MSKRNSTVEIVDGKVVFSKEVLEYFESIRNEENSEWIDKYFEVLSDENNLTATKFHSHHIRPCHTFKTEGYKTRNQTQKLGNEFNGNLIKLSIYNHLFAHYYLWKICDDKDSKFVFQSMSGESNYIENLTENELKEIARLKEECAKENQTEEEKKEYHRLYCKKWRKEHPDYDKTEKAKEYKRIWQINNKDRLKEKRKNQPKTEKQKIAERLNSKKYYETHKNDEKFKEGRKRQKAKESSKIQARNYSREKYKNNKEEILEKTKQLNARKCIDPIKGEECTYCALKHRKSKYKELYKNVILSQCVIQTSTPST